MNVSDLLDVLNAGTRYEKGVIYTRTKPCGPATEIFAGRLCDIPSRFSYLEIAKVCVFTTKKGYLIWKIYLNRF